MTVRVYHFQEGEPISKLKKHTLLGEVNFLLASLMVAKDQKMSPALVGGKEK